MAWQIPKVSIRMRIRIRFSKYSRIRTRVSKVWSDPDPELIWTSRLIIKIPLKPNFSCSIYYLLTKVSYWLLFRKKKIEGLISQVGSGSGFFLQGRIQIRVFLQGRIRTLYSRKWDLDPVFSSRSIPDPDPFFLLQKFGTGSLFVLLSQVWIRGFFLEIRIRILIKSTRIRIRPFRKKYTRILP